MARTRAVNLHLHHPDNLHTRDTSRPVTRLVEIRLLIRILIRDMDSILILAADRIQILVIRAMYRIRTRDTQAAFRIQTRDIRAAFRIPIRAIREMARILI